MYAMSGLVFAAANFRVVLWRERLCCDWWVDAEVGDQRSCSTTWCEVGQLEGRKRWSNGTQHGV